MRTSSVLRPRTLFHGVYRGIDRRARWNDIAVRRCWTSSATRCGGGHPRLTVYRTRGTGDCLRSGRRWMPGSPLRRIGDAERTVRAGGHHPSTLYARDDSRRYRHCTRPFFPSRCPVCTRSTLKISAGAVPGPGVGRDAANRMIRRLGTIGSNAPRCRPESSRFRSRHRVQTGNADREAASVSRVGRWRADARRLRWVFTQQSGRRGSGKRHPACPRITPPRSLAQGGSRAAVATSRGGMRSCAVRQWKLELRLRIVSRVPSYYLAVMPFSGRWPAGLTVGLGVWGLRTLTTSLENSLV